MDGGQLGGGTGQRRAGDDHDNDDQDDNHGDHDHDDRDHESSRHHQVTGWFWALDLPRLASRSSSSKCVGQRKRSNRDGADGEVTNGDNEEVINVTGEEGTGVGKRPSNSGNTMLVASIASSLVLVLTLVVVFVALWLRRRWRSGETFEKEDNNYDYGVYYG